MSCMGVLTIDGSAPWCMSGALNKFCTREISRQQTNKTSTPLLLASLPKGVSLQHIEQLKKVVEIWGLSDSRTFLLGIGHF